jgi:hypothetical protein
MAADTRLGAADDPDAPDPLLLPAWEESSDETDADRPGARPRWGTRPTDTRPATRRDDAWPAGEDLVGLLSPLCDAADALARLDARAAAAPDTMRDGLVARMALAEAAGWLAHAHAWVHPLDLALRDAGLTGSTAVAAAGRGHLALPQTFAGRRTDAGGHTDASGRSDADGRSDWDHQTVDAVADGDRALADALALAQALRRLAGARGAKPFTTAADAEAMLGGFGAGPLDAMRFVEWRETFAPAPVPRRRFGSREGQGGPKPPALLRAAQAAAAWMEAGIADDPTPLQAVLAAIALLAGGGPAATVCVPVWAAYPAVGFGDRAALPTLRSDAADRLIDRDQPVTWPLAFLHLVAESARMGLRTLDRLEAAAAQGKGLAAAADKRSRLPDAVDALLRAPVLTPKALAARLGIASQTGTALLRALAAKGLVREVTGRGSFRAFAV